MRGGVFQRLTGLETEYVARFRADEDSERPLTFELLQKLAGELRRRLPLVQADYPKKGYFLATGGAVWQERPGEGVDHPLIEGSTPECRGARQLLIYQRAQDRLLSTAARDVGGGEFTLCKSDCDAHGNVYGSQENYSVEMAEGRRLAVWRLGVFFVLLPLMALGWVAIFPLVFALLGYYALAGGVYLLLLPAIVSIPVKGRTHVKIREGLFGPWGGELFRFMPGWLAMLVTTYERIIFAPAALALTLLAGATAYVQVRRGLLAFLITRTIFTGNGRVWRNGKFRISSKASGFHLSNGTGIFRIHSVFSFGPLFKALMFFAIAPGHQKFPSVLDRRQRLHVCLCDSNMCEEAEYLRIGTAMLVIDAIEAGFAFEIPRLSRPMAALRKIIADPTLRVRVATADGREMSALEIQRVYLEGCKRFVESRTRVPADARDVLKRWEAVLDDLESAPERLVGRVDWITKRWLLEQAGAGTSAAARKKIDLRYHELSPEGYFEQLRSAGVVTSVLSDEEIEAALVTAPPNSPATERGFHIRQLGSGKLVKANWRSVVIGMPPKVVWMAAES